MKNIKIIKNPDMSESIRYDSTELPVSIFTGYKSELNNHYTRKHWHNDIEFVKIIDGEINYNINGKIVSLKKGEGLFINSKQFHYNFPHDEKECKFICVILHPVLMCSSKTIAEKYVSPILSNSAIPYHIFKECDWEKTVLSCIENIHSLKNEDGFELNLYGEFFKLWTEMYINLSNKTLKKSQDTQHLTELKNMISFIKEHYKEKIGLLNIANAGGVCKTSCCNIFKQFTNQTPGEYLTDYRLQKSIELMQNTDMTFTEICYDVGFFGASYFSETFKKVLGVTPSEYKKMASN